MKDKPQISIITCSYNYEKYIKDTIESVLNQSFQDWEMIIVDDGSSDNSVSIIQEYCQKDSRIKFYQHKKGRNRGLSKTLQLGLSKASADWVTFLEADDMFTPDNLEEKIKLIKTDKQLNFIFNDFKIIGDESFEQMPYCIQFRRDMTEREGFFDYRKQFYYKNPIPTFSVVTVKKELLKNIDFNSPIKPALDRYLWSQIAVNYKFYFLNKKLSLWRKHQTSYYTKNKKKITYFKRFIFYLYTAKFMPDLFINKLKKMLLVIRISC